MVDLSIVIPAYREEENLRLILPRLREVIKKLGVDSETVIIDTEQSMDNTAKLCAEHDVRYVNRRGGNTYGSAVRTGIASATGTHIVMMDADGSHPPEFIAELYRHVNKADIIIASRYIKGGGTENPVSLILLSYILNVVYSWLLGIRCKDISNSFRLYDGQQLRKLDLKCHNFDIVEEILVCSVLANKHLSILEIPFVFKKRLFGTTKRNLFFIVTFCTTLLRLMAIRFSQPKR